LASFSNDELLMELEKQNNFIEMGMVRELGWLIYQVNKKIVNALPDMKSEIKTTKDKRKFRWTLRRRPSKHKKPNLPTTNEAVLMEVG